MTEYGRGPGSEPWHPEDPLYGDQGWGGQQQYPQQAQYGQDQYGQGQYPQDPYPQGSYAQDQYGQGGQQGYDPQYQQPHQQPHPQQGQQPQQYSDPQYGNQTYGGQQGYSGQGYDTPGYPAQQYDTGWETGQAAMPYGATPADPYGGQNPDLYGTPEAYPPPQPPGRRQGPPEPVIDWEAEPEEEERHPFFTGEDGADDDGHDDHDDERSGDGSSRGGRDRRGGKGQKNKKGKNGVACLVVALVLVGGVGGIGYFGYQFWQGQFGAAPDYAGEGSGEVQVEIPKSAGGYEIGNILKKAGVVKSVDAFVSAQGKNPKGLSIQAGVYTLKKEMSAESAVTLMLSPASQANFVIPEGKRNVWVYEQIDKKLDLKAGTTQGIAKAKAKDLGLPDWATNHADLKDPLEGFLFPASYPVAKGNKPEDVLRKMVARSNEEYAKYDLEAKAKQLGVESPWQLITIASLVQAEGTSHDDFRKMAEVVYNRLKPSNPQTFGKLEFDSTYNYIKNQSKIDLTLEELRKYDNLYNTYFYKGLPPGPIGNPGNEALQGVVNPTSDGWYYFISLDGKTSKFTKTNADHQKLVNEFNKSR
ncbi:endolytic transglycosylase MltG [Streptomyces sp. Je 1-79]|uniref:endolytic transglycosylase MltG n=1 Tax=Streptomyces sp. Je 1-79 TaxID=2943847 RepID=UPI0021A83FAB|nr:endolytic transglycosylase MltG [Streptomyces sp. Je 1-79]MCT4356800.1 endolytic transglycosylase MltG [Streptomyces sp. Je 1-79]